LYVLIYHYEIHTDLQLAELLLIMSWTEPVAALSKLYPDISVDGPKTRVILRSKTEKSPIQNTKAEPPKRETIIPISIKL
jgi:hypothetical protein